MLDNVQLEPQRKSSDRRALADDDSRPVKKPKIVVNDKKQTDSSEIQDQEVCFCSVIFVNNSTFHTLLPWVKYMTKIVQQDSISIQQLTTTYKNFSINFLLSAYINKNK